MSYKKIWFRAVSRFDKANYYKRANSDELHVLAAHNEILFKPAGCNQLKAHPVSRRLESRSAVVMEADLVNGFYTEPELGKMGFATISQLVNSTMPLVCGESSF